MTVTCTASREALRGVTDTGVGLDGDHADPTIQSLYDGWLTQGSQSLAEAYKVGIALEKRDIADLEAELKTVKQADVKVVLEHLRWSRGDAVR